jgi:hypothetical protein
LDAVAGLLSMTRDLSDGMVGSLVEDCPVASLVLEGEVDGLTGLGVRLALDSCRAFRSFERRAFVTRSVANSTKGARNLSTTPTTVAV